MAVGNTLTIRSAAIDAPIYLLQVWDHAQADGEVRIRSPRLHDVNNGIRLQTEQDMPKPLLPWGIKQRLYTEDVLTVEAAGSATAGDIETVSMLIYYSDLPGVNAHLITTAELQARMHNILAVKTTLPLGTTGGYSGQKAINAETDVFKSNTEYALLGFTNTVLTATIRYQAFSFGNLGLGGPGQTTDPDLTANWFVRLSEAYGLPLIPVFNGNDKNNVLIDGAQNENGADAVISTIYAELAPPS